MNQAWLLKRRPEGVDFGRALMSRLTIQRFVVLDHFPRARESYPDLTNWIQFGRLRWKDHVVHGLEYAGTINTALAQEQVGAKQ